MMQDFMNRYRKLITKQGPPLKKELLGSWANNERRWQQGHLTACMPTCQTNMTYPYEHLLVINHISIELIVVAFVLQEAAATLSLPDTRPF